MALPQTSVPAISTTFSHIVVLHTNVSLPLFYHVPVFLSLLLLLKKHQLKLTEADALRSVALGVGSMVEVRPRLGNLAGGFALSFVGVQTVAAPPLASEDFRAYHRRDSIARRLAAFWAASEAAASGAVASGAAASDNSSASSGSASDGGATLLASLLEAASTPSPRAHGLVTTDSPTFDRGREHGGGSVQCEGEITEGGGGGAPGEGGDGVDRARTSPCGKRWTRTHFEAYSSRIIAVGLASGAGGEKVWSFAEKDVLHALGHGPRAEFELGKYFNSINDMLVNHGSEDRFIYFWRNFFRRTSHNLSLFFEYKLASFQRHSGRQVRCPWSDR
jgi:hypothetical protein